MRCKRSYHQLSIFLLLPLVYLLQPSIAISQGNNSVIRGIVRGENNQPLVGVSVILRNAETNFTTGASTDSAGVFSFSKVPSGGPYGFSFSIISYETQTMSGYQVKADAVLSLDVEMKPLAKSMNEVIVLGYGSLRRRDVTGSSSKVNESIIKETPPTTLENALQGRMPGVVITNTSAEPGGGISIQVRGITSLSGGNQPLYVIDGVPMFNDNGRSPQEFEGNVPTNFLASINPSDILSVEVLKDASATAIYGSRGANGVVMITTKRGKAGQARVEFSQFTSLGQSPKPIPLANAKEYAIFFNTMLTNTGLPEQYVGAYAKSSNGLDSLYFPSTAELGEGTNWQKQLFRNAITQNYQVSVSGGSDNIRYLLSGSFLEDKGVVKVSDYKKGSLRANLDAKASDKLSFQFNLNLTTDKNDRAENANSRGTGGFERSGVILKSFAANPVWSPDNLTSRSQGNFNNTTFYLTMLNPLYDLENTINTRKINQTLTSVDIKYKFSKALDLTVRGGYNATEAATDMYWNLNTQLGYLRGQKTFQSRWKGTSYLNENFLTFTKGTNDYSLNLVGGVSWQKSIAESSVLGGENLPVPTDNGLYLLPLYGARDIPVTNRIDELLLSAYGRAVFSYRSRYLVTFTGRTDGSSHFAANKKWAFFPSVGLGWNFTQENFLKKITSVLSSGKLRASFGTSGNQSIAAYQSLPSLAPLSYGFVNGAVTGVVTENPGNPDLTWETTKQFDAGLELGFLNDRFTFTLDVYKKRTDDLLQPKAIPSASGYASILSNFGSIENKGIELDLGASIVKGKKFSWDASFNISANRSKVLDLGENVNYYNYSNGSTGGADYTHRITVGGPLGVFWGFKTDGLLTEKDIQDNYPKISAALGEGGIKVLDLDSNGVINDNDRTAIGNAFPKYTLGLNNSFTYGNFTFSVFLNAVLGQDILNENHVWTEYGTTIGIPTKDYINDYWTPENKNAYYPKPSLYNPNYQTFDRLVEKGSYLRVKNVMLRYNFTKLPKWINKFQAYVTVNNLHTFTSYSGYDPEVSAYGQNNLLAGMDFGSYPRSRYWTVGFDFGF